MDSESRPNETRSLRLGLPKGRIQVALFELLAEAGLCPRQGFRHYRPELAFPGFEVKILKPQDIVQMLHAGRRDLGFAGADWVEELDADVVTLLDTELDPVRVILAGPSDSSVRPNREVLVATEYVNLTRKWTRESGWNAQVIRSYGATEVFPPEDADYIVDNTATGTTLKAHGLQVEEVLLESSTRLYANPQSYEDPVRREEIEAFVTLVGSALEARRRVMLEINVDPASLEAIVDALPCMREPTVSRLYGEEAYGVKAAVPREGLPALLVELKRRGATDLVVTSPSQIVP